MIFENSEINEANASWQLLKIDCSKEIINNLLAGDFDQITDSPREQAAIIAIALTEMLERSLNPVSDLRLVEETIEKLDMTEGYRELVFDYIEAVVLA